MVLPPNYEQRKKEREEQEKQREIDREEFKRFMAESRAFRKKLKEDRKAYRSASATTSTTISATSESASSISGDGLPTQEEKQALVPSSAELVVTNMCMALAAISVITMFFNFFTGFVLILSALVLFCAGTFRGTLRRNTKQSIAREKRKRNKRAKAAGQEKYVPISGNAGCWIGLMLALGLAFPLILVINTSSTPLYFTVIGVLSFLVLVLV